MCKREGDGGEEGRVIKTARALPTTILVVADGEGREVETCPSKILFTHYASRTIDWEGERDRLFLKCMLARASLHCLIVPSKPPNRLVVDCPP